MMWNEKLKSLRGDKTIEEVAAAMMLNPNMYEAYEKGERMPLDPVKKIIADYFGASEETIWKS